MRDERGRAVEVESLEEFDGRVSAGARSLSGWHVQSVDLTARSDVLRALDPGGALFLGCALLPADERSLRDRGALVFPAVPDVPLDSYRAGLYNASELFSGLDDGYEHTVDARVYAWSQQRRTPDVALAQALHDHAIDSALRKVAQGRPVVGVMGGHAVARGSAAYAGAARLAHGLTGTGLTVATGGGPGAMEAANLGAYLAGRAPAELDEALAALAAVPSFEPSVGAWARAALDVVARWPRGERSIGIPTWHYGHEPPNVFATDIAKYVKNAVREAVLLHLSSAGIVFLPGAAGTVQEIFQDACENYYADPSSVAPMVLVGRDHWTRTLPVWPLLRSLAEGRHMADRVHLVDDVSEVLPLLSTAH